MRDWFPYGGLLSPHFAGSCVVMFLGYLWTLYPRQPYVSPVDEESYDVVAWLAVCGFRNPSLGQGLHALAALAVA